MIKYIAGDENFIRTIRDYDFEEGIKYIKDLIKDTMLTRNSKKICIYQRVEDENLTILWEE